MSCVQRVAVWALAVVSAASAFHTVAPIRCSSSFVFVVPSSPASTNHQPQPHRAARRASTLCQFANDEDEIDEEYELVEFFVSPEQISMLRKEASKRDRRKELSKFFLSAEESKEISPETMEEINNLFDGSELIEVRGVSKDSKKQVFDAAHGLAATLEDAIEKPVVVVDIKGFAVKLYCPWDDEEREGRIQLRTSYKPGQWKRKAKPIRDNRGQIITGEDGKSIKEIPEY